MAHNGPSVFINSHVFLVEYERLKRLEKREVNADNLISYQHIIH